MEGTESAPMKGRTERAPRNSANKSPAEERMEEAPAKKHRESQRERGHGKTPAKVRTEIETADDCARKSPAKERT